MGGQAGSDIAQTPEMEDVKKGRRVHSLKKGLRKKQGVNIKPPVLRFSLLIPSKTTLMQPTDRTAYIPILNQGIGSDLHLMFL